MKRKQWTDAERVVARRLKQQGWTRARIASKFGVSSESIKNLLRLKTKPIYSAQANRGCRKKRAPCVPILNPRKGMFDSTAAVDRLLEMWAA